LPAAWFGFNLAVVYVVVDEIKGILISARKGSPAGGDLVSIAVSVRLQVVKLHLAVLVVLQGLGRWPPGWRKRARLMPGPFSARMR
jgi:hypothetical protein